MEGGDYMKICIYRGYCPQFNEDKTIQIGLDPVLMTKKGVGYKKLDFNCPNVQMCQHLDKYGRCPLFIEAPSHP
jgi:hypothetical protein